MRLTNRKLNSIGSGLHECFDRFFEILDSLEKPSLIEESMIDGDIKTAIGL
jgi:hypothetical protein